jgi:GxxExxY protein
MPITAEIIVTLPSEDEFKEIAYAVTGAAFALHKEYGSLFAEKVYQYELARRCCDLGLKQVRIELPIQVAFDSFEKEYFADLVVDGKAVFELKGASALHARHRAQTLNYLYLLGLPRAKLISFRSDSVEHEFVSTTLSLDQRRQFSLDKEEWTPCGPDDTWFAERLIAIVEDWGAFLEVAIYHEAMVHFLGGPDRVIVDLPVMCDGQAVATQKVHLLAPGIAFKLTAVSRNLAIVEDHLRRFLAHTPLYAIQWVNFDHHDITFKTLLSPSWKSKAAR